MSPALAWLERFSDLCAAVESSAPKQGKRRPGGLQTSWVIA